MKGQRLISLLLYFYSHTDIVVVFNYSMALNYFIIKIKVYEKLFKKLIDNYCINLYYCILCKIRRVRLEVVGFGKISVYIGISFYIANGYRNRGNRAN